MTELAIDPDHAPRALRSGELVGSRYRLDGVAGTGGMATVWRAYDERLQRPVAIKVISDALTNNPAAVARFAREARTHAGIQHPNLVNVYDYSVTAAQPYLVMEYIGGSTLSERLDRGGFPAAAIQTLAAELLSAIACVHDHGVLHRDIKPANVLLDNDGHVRLTDFGLARLEDSTQITHANEVVGTLRFLAPELIEGQQASKQSDLYALGVLLRTASEDADSAAGRERAELANRDNHQLLGRHAGQQHEEPAGGRFARLISWLTAHDPKDRPHDAHAALAALPKRQQEQRTRIPHESEAQTKLLPLTRRTRYMAGNRLRSRTVAVTALLAAAAGTALVVIDAESGSARGNPPARVSQTANTRTHGATQTHGAAARQHHVVGAGRADDRTIGRQLQQLANEVRHAAQT
ncbi:MAG: serine/threonine protein kinase [Acidobacteriota bacterium]|nr:serine/threonine protein kinase [Acidobacteriota bacterium]